MNSNNLRKEVIAVSNQQQLVNQAQNDVNKGKGLADPKSFESTKDYQTYETAYKNAQNKK